MSTNSDRRTYQNISRRPLSLALTWRTGLAALAVLVALPAFCGDELEPSAPPPGATGAWLTAVQSTIEAAEYAVTWQDATVLPDLAASWHAPNRSQNLRAYFTEGGVRVVRRTESSPTWELALTLTGSGRGEAVSAAGRPRLSPHENRIDFDRGTIVEWYVNDTRGLEQGFTLNARPLPARDAAGPFLPGARGLHRGETETTAPAYLVVAIGGALSPLISADGRAVEFVAPGGAKVLSYSKLRVFDARGRDLPAWIEGFAEAGVRGLRLVFDDAGASYPVTVDPLLSGAAWTAESDQAGALFGCSVAAAGDVNGDGYGDLLVGAYNYDGGQTDEGRAFVFHGSAAGLSASPAWTAESNQAAARFGVAVAGAGDVNGDGYADIVVGAYNYDDTETDEGRAFVFHGAAGGLRPTAAWSADGDQANAYFGLSVAAAGDVDGDGYSDVVVGAEGAERAFVFHGSAGGLGAAPAWTGDSGQPGSSFGRSVATAGDVNGDGFSDVIVGATTYENGQDNEGRAFVFHGSPSGVSATAAWTAEPDQAQASFGWSVSTAGDVNGDGFADVIVGAYTYSDREPGQGRAFVYHGSKFGLLPTAVWTASGVAEMDYFGFSVGTAGDVDGDGYADVIVGSERYEDGETDEGRALVFHGSAGGLAATPGWTAESDQAGALYGRSVATAGDVNGDGFSDVVVGASFYDNGQASEGRAFLYHGAPAGLSAAAGWSVGTDQVSKLGRSVSTAGDVNGDGFADILVGADFYDGGLSGEGRVSLFLGSAAGPLASPAWTVEGNQQFAHLGSSVSTAGDVDGDGYDDVIVAAVGYDDGEEDEGRVFAYHGSPTGLAGAPAWTAEGGQIGASFGDSLAAAGDVNGDGYDDVIVGAPFFSNGEPGEGRAFVYHGSADGLGLSPAWTAESDQGGAAFGRAVSTAGDANGDGYDDVIVGAPDYFVSVGGEGRAFFFRGSAAGLEGTASWTRTGQPGRTFGSSVASAGDVNGDGYADLVIGAVGYGGGRADVHHGSSGGPSPSPAWSVESPLPNSSFGHSVASAGDVNGDGFADVVVGQPHFEEGGLAVGRALVYHGSAAGLAITESWLAEGPGGDIAFFGWDVGTAGDVNGDGYADLIVGAPDADGGVAEGGIASLFFGNGSAGLAPIPQQKRADGDGPIAARGRSRAPGSFRLASRGRSPLGRDRVRLEWEVQPWGQPFDGTVTGQSAWLDAGTKGIAVEELVTGLAPGAHHWRVRWRYDGIRSPFLGAGRWLTTPWGGWQERSLTVSPFLGGEVWEDRDGDGIMAPDERRLAGVQVWLVDAAGAPLESRLTGPDGTYRFDVGSGGQLRLRFDLPAGWTFTPRDQGGDDLADSDASTVTGETSLIAPPYDATDEQRWSAGLRRAAVCLPPDEPVYIYAVTLTTDGNAYPVLNFQDPNQPADVTGYNIYRSSSAALPSEEWPLLADDVVDMDGAQPNGQWVDTTGDVSPSGVWYYEVAATNNACPPESAEGPRD